jgi:ankyrin repeat protein
MKKWCPMKRILFSIVCIFLIPAVFAEAGMADKNAPLIQAAEKGNLPEVQVALNNGADVNVKRSSDGGTALMMASEKGHTEIVKLLLNKGANLKAKTTIDDIDYTALGIAKLKGKKDIIEMLEKAGAKE